MLGGGGGVRRREEALRSRGGAGGTRRRCGAEGSEAALRIRTVFNCIAQKCWTLLFNFLPNETGRVVRSEVDIVI